MSSPPKPTENHIIATLRTLQLSHRQTILQQINQPSSSSLHQVWRFISAALLAPSWLCSPEQLKIKAEIQQAVLQTPTIVHLMLEEYNLNDQWRKGANSPVDLLEGFTALAILVDLVDQPLKEDLLIFLQYTQYVFSADPIRFSQVVRHAKALIDEFAFDFGYVADYLEEVVENEHFFQSSTLSIPETRTRLTSWIKKQYVQNENLRQWLPQTSSKIQRFLKSPAKLASAGRSLVIWSVESERLDLVIIHNEIYFCWDGKNPPIDLYMGRQRLQTELEANVWKKKKCTYWKFPEDPSYSVSFEWDGIAHKLSLR